MQLSVIFNEISPFFGRFHPLLIHLPIGFIFVAYLLELAGKTDKRSHLKLSVPFVLWLAAISSVLAVITGYILAQSGGYGEEAVFWHQWMGISVAILIITTLLFYNTKSYFFVFSLTIIALLITGHLGGNLTHGETYLTEHLPEELKDVFGIEGDTYVVEAVSYNEAMLYKHLIYPILRNKCMGCHNNSKMKGELNMKDFEAFLRGGENGEVIIKGHSKRSDMVKRILLSENHDDTMPPEGKERINREELELITLWIDQDMEEDTYLDSLEISDEIKEDIFFRLQKKEEVLSPVFELKVQNASESKMENLRKLGFNVLPVKKGSPFLQVTYFDRINPIDEERKNALLAISDQLVWLDLTGVKNTDDNWLLLKSFPNLVKLHLSNTSVTDETIIALAKNKYLETIGLFGTSTSKAILKPISELEYLESIYLGNTNISAQDTISLNLNPKTKIIF